MPKKQKKYLSKTERDALRKDLRPALDMPYRSATRGDLVRTAAAMYDVTPGVVYDVLNSMRRSPVVPKNAITAANGAPVPSAAPVAGGPIAYRLTDAPTTYELKIGDMTISTASKQELLGVLDKLLVEKER